MNSQKVLKNDNSNPSSSSIQSDGTKEGPKNSESKSKSQNSEKKPLTVDKNRTDTAVKGNEKVETTRISSIESIIHDPNIKGFFKNSVEIDGLRIEFFRNYQEFRISKQQESERKQKWKKWQKTDFRNTSSNSQKFDFFSDSSEEELIEGSNLSKNLSLKTLEKNVENLRKERETAKNKAIEKKNAGNEFILKKDYQNAVKLYTEGLEYAKDFKELYTNRALAYLKMSEYQKAIQDCTRILEFIECFECGFTQSSSICVKAFLRRALAYKELGLYEESMQDIEQVFKLIPNDKDAQRIKDEIESIKASQNNPEQTNTVLLHVGASEGHPIYVAGNIEQIIPKIDAFVQDDTLDIELVIFLTMVFNASELMCAYAHKQGIIRKFVSIFKNYNFEVRVCYLFIAFAKGHSDYQLEFLLLNGGDELTKLAINLSNLIPIDAKDPEKIKKFIHSCHSVGQIIEIFIIFTENEKPAEIIQSYEILSRLPALLYTRLIALLNFDTDTITSLMGLIMNLTAISKESLMIVRENFLADILSDAVNYILPVPNASLLRLKGNLYGLIAHMLADEKARTKLLQNIEDFLKFLKATLENIQLISISSPSNLRWISSVEGALCLFINIAFNASEEELQIVFGTKLCIFDHFKRFLGLSRDRPIFQKIILRTLQLFSKLDFQEAFLIDSRADILSSFRMHLDSKARALGHANHALRLYIRWFDKRNLYVFQSFFKPKDFNDLIENLHEIFKEEDAERFANGCTLAGNLVEMFPALSEKFEGDIKTLLAAVRLRSGDERRNVGILLAKLSKNTENFRVITENNGFQILAELKKSLLGKPL